MNRPPDFNRLARLYRWMEALTFGPWLWWCRCTWLHNLNLANLNPSSSLDSSSSQTRALVLGDGDGRFTARLLRTNPHLRIDAVDASSAMLHSLQTRAESNATRLRVFLADAREFHPPTPPYQLIVTHFFLDCLTTTEVQTLAATIKRAAAPNAEWLISEFAIPPGSFGRLIARPLVWFLYLVFGGLTGLTLRALPDYKAALTQSGFRKLKQRTLLGGLLTSELWTAADQA